MNIHSFFVAFDQLCRLPSEEALEKAEIEVDGKKYKYEDLLHVFKNFDVFYNDYQDYVNVKNALEMLKSRMIKESVLSQAQNKISDISQATLSDATLKKYKDETSRAIKVCNYAIYTIESSINDTEILIDNVRTSLELKRELPAYYISFFLFNKLGLMKNKEFSDFYDSLDSFTWLQKRSLIQDKMNQLFNAEFSKEALSVIDRYYSILDVCTQEEEKFIVKTIGELDKTLSTMKKGSNFVDLAIKAINDAKAKALLFLDDFYIQKKRPSGMHDFVEDFQAARKEIFAKGKTRERSDLYLSEGVCAGASLAYAIERLNNSGKSGIQPNAQARFIQVLYEMERKQTRPIAKGLDLSLTIWEYESEIEKINQIQETENKNNANEEKLKQLKKQLEDAKKEFEIVVNQFSTEGMELPEQFKNQKNVKVTEIIGPEGIWSHSPIKIDEFFNITMEKLKKEFGDKPLHLLVHLADRPNISTINSINESEKIVPKLDNNMLNQRVDEILGKDAPANAKKALKMALISENTQIEIPDMRHTIYVCLNPTHEMQDVNYPGFKGIKADDFNTFKLFLLTWFAAHPYQTIYGIELVERRVQSS